MNKMNNLDKWIKCTSEIIPEWERSWGVKIRKGMPGWKVGRVGKKGRREWAWAEASANEPRGHKSWDREQRMKPLDWLRNGIEMRINTRRWGICKRIRAVKLRKTGVGAILTMFFSSPGGPRTLKLFVGPFLHAGGGLTNCLCTHFHGSYLRFVFCILE